MKLKGYFWIISSLGNRCGGRTRGACVARKAAAVLECRSRGPDYTALFIGLYRKLVRPYQLLFSGIDLLRQQDFASRLRPIRNREANQLIEVFNRDDHTTQAGAFRSARKEPFSRPVDPSLAARCNHPRFRRTDFRDQSCGIEIIENRGFFTGQRAFAGGSALRIDPRAGRVGTLRRDGDPDSGPPRLPLHQILVYGPRFRAPFPAGRRADPGGNETRERVVRTDHPDDRPRGQQLGRGDRFYALRGIGCTPAGRTP